MTKILSTEESALEEAAAILKKGGVIAFPTETVYGLGCMLHDVKAREKIYDIKKRTSDKPLLLHISNFEQMYAVASVTNEALKLAKAYLPGPLTLILKKNPSFTFWEEETIGIRMPSEKNALKIIEKTGPLLATSANLSGEPPCLDLDSLVAQFFGKIEAIVDGGRALLGVPSTIVSLIDRPKILRQGMIYLNDTNL